MTNDYLQNTFGLNGKTAIVTGASRGLGQGMAIGLAQAGANIIAVSTRKENLDETCARISALGRTVLPLSCDQTKPEQIEAVIKEAQANFDSIDILINNAGTIRRAPAHEYSDDDWQTVINTNLNGVFQFCRGVGKIMLDQKSGKIINIASIRTY